MWQYTKLLKDCLKNADNKTNFLIFSAVHIAQVIESGSPKTTAINADWTKVTDFKDTEISGLSLKKTTLNITKLKKHVITVSD